MTGVFSRTTLDSEGMDKLNFYHQKRADGGLRSGIDFNEERVWERFEAGALPQDSALLWFVDVRCSADKLPSEPEAIRRWFSDRSGVIQFTLNQLANELSAGIDSGWPLKKEVPTKDGVQMTVYCSAIRRLTGREISKVLADLSCDWPELIARLDSYEHSILTHG
jgi:hypothetical protein